MLEMGRTGEWWFAISPLVSGTFLEEMDAEGFTAALPSVLDALVAMSRVRIGTRSTFGPWGPTGRGAYQSWKAYLLDVASDPPGFRTHGWRARLSLQPEAEDVFASGYAALEEAAPLLPELQGLVHNDLVHRNVFVDEGRVTGIIDWGCSLIGDGLYDVALMGFWAPTFPGMDEGRLFEAVRGRLEEGATGRFEERIRAYLIHIGLVHIAYNAFLNRERKEDMENVCQRLQEILRR